RRRASRLRPGTCDRPRLRRSQRRPGARRVAARPGDGLRDRAAAGRRRAGGPDPRENVSAPPLRVLVCDDELQILRGLKIVLRDAGFDVAVAQTAQEALDAAALRPPEAAIAD